MKFFARALFCMTIALYFSKTFAVKDIDDWEESDEIRMRAKANRRFSHTKEELELTKAVPRIDPISCNDVQPVSVFIHSAARSVGKYFDKRQTLRNTWVQEIKKLNVSVFFAIALNANESVNDMLREESDKYEDMIQFEFIDAYYNLTLKLTSILRWVNNNCLNSTHILKTDDDVVVNSRLLIDELTEFKTGISGSMASSKPQRDPKEKWFMPSEYYPNDTYPDFMHGAALMVSMNIIPDILKTLNTYTGYFLDIDDLFITGIIAEKAGIQRYNNKLIDFIGCHDVCAFFEKVVMFQCEDTEETKAFWSKWKDTSYEYCGNKFYLKVSLIFLGVVAVIALVVGLAFGSYYLYTNSK